MIAMYLVLFEIFNIHWPIMQQRQGAHAGLRRYKNISFSFPFYKDI